MEITNPFDNPDMRNYLMSKEGVKDNTDAIIPEPVDDLEMIASHAPKIPKSNQIQNIIHDADSLVRQSNDQRSAEIAASMNELLSQYNDKFGLNLSLNLDSMSKSLVMVADPTSRRALELAVSEIFGGMKSLIYLRMISGLNLLTEELFSANSLLSNELSLPDKFTLFSKLLEYTAMLEELNKSIHITGAQQELAQLGKEAQENSGDMTSGLSDDARKLLDILKKKK